MYNDNSCDMDRPEFQRVIKQCADRIRKDVDNKIIASVIAKSKKKRRYRHVRK